MRKNEKCGSAMMRSLYQQKEEHMIQLMKGVRYY